MTKFVLKYFRFVEHVKHPSHLNQNKCQKPCKSSGDQDECLTGTNGGFDENGCLFEVCWSNGSCGPLLK